MAKLGPNEARRVLVEAAPTAGVAALACLEAWFERGSVAARHWLPYAIVAALLLATVLLAGTARRPSRSALASLAALAALAVWTAISILWAPAPALARDESLLVALYAVVLAIPVVTLRSPASRLLGLAAVVTAFGLLAVATALELRYGTSQLDHFRGRGRLYFPVGYVNAQTAVALVAFWPAVVLGARRTSHPFARALALGAASTMLAIALLTQSRGGAIALAASAIFVFAALPVRLRLVLPTLIPVAATAVAFDTLTAPFGATVAADPQLAQSIRDGGATALLVGLAGTVVALVYALADRRLVVPRRAVRAAGATLIAASVFAAGAGAVAFLERVDEPTRWLSERWQTFKQEPESETAETHFLNPGSNRYDFWRVALLEFGDHPVRGAGARSFGPAYLLRGESSETPTRTHSLLLEQLSEGGAVGLALLAIALVPAFAAGLRRRALVPAAGAVAGAVYWIVHALGDWLWTFPACGIPFFLLLGIALARDRPRLPRTPRFVAAGVAVAIAVLAFAPPWLAARYAERGAERGLPAGAEDFRRARTLDPLDVESLLVQSQLARTNAERIRLLRLAVEREPEIVRNHYLLGLALLDAGRRDDARRQLTKALALYPRSETIRAALDRTR